MYLAIKKHEPHLVLYGCSFCYNYVSILHRKKGYIFIKSIYKKYRYRAKRQDVRKGRSEKELKEAIAAMFHSACSAWVYQLGGLAMVVVVALPRRGCGAGFQRSGVWFSVRRSRNVVQKGLWNPFVTGEWETQATE